eukprot:6206171-Pleurochrysis_carterae.AAC.3
MYFVAKGFVPKKGGKNAAIDAPERLVVEVNAVERLHPGGEAGRQRPSAEIDQPDQDHVIELRQKVSARCVEAALVSHLPQQLDRRLRPKGVGSDLDKTLSELNDTQLSGSDAVPCVLCD